VDVVQEQLPMAQDQDAAWALTDIIIRIRRILRASVRAEIPWEALPMAQVEILQRLADEPGLRVSDLARRHRLATNTVSTIVQQMVVGGLIVREPVPDDRRAVSLHLTDRGQASLDGWLQANYARVEVAWGTLAPREREKIAEALGSLRTLVDNLDVVPESGDVPAINVV